MEQRPGTADGRGVERTRTLTIEKVGVIGAGQMGNGIAHVSALNGYDVVLNDIDEAALDGAMATIRGNLERQLRRGVIADSDIDATLSRIVPTLGLEAMKECDIVIEAATEDEATKRAILKQLEGNLKADAIIASNTSSISITRLAAVTDRPERFIGMHFMNPVPMMQLIELIRGLGTNEETYSTAAGLARSLGKTVAQSEDFPAFIVNRILLPMINEAIYTLYEGVGTVEAIDTAMKLGANHPMGPLELADFIGLDTALAVMQVLYDGLADSKYRPCPLLVKYVEAGWLGRKVGRGFYDYSGETPVPTR
ncbi:MAG: 3-hydroxybutyryl-CoA dehydrogenase [Rhodospirillaceae bacterium]|nr:3-hydroxybutyryl-CoA dehydrogenase [Rhodospirillaceae bacterium]MDE0702446.1 3-hydroxybutyryl-CoA dehydrogenase [Rhodospirillaceae bacterium]